MLVDGPGPKPKVLFPDGYHMLPHYKVVCFKGQQLVIPSHVLCPMIAIAVPRISSNPAKQFRFLLQKVSRLEFGLIRTAGTSSDSGRCCHLVFMYKTIPVDFCFLERLETTK